MIFKSRGLILLGMFLIAIGLPTHNFAQHNTAQQPAPCGSECLTQKLIKAVFAEDVQGAEEALIMGADPNVSLSVYGQSLLFAMTASGNLPMIEILVKYGAKIDALDIQRRTPIFLAAYNGHFSVVEFLVNQGASLDVRDVWKNTIMHFAAVGGLAEDISMIQFLVNQGLQTNTKNDLGEIPLHSATLFGSLSAVEFLVKQDDLAILQTDRLGRVALHRAAFRGDLSIVKAVLDLDNVSWPSEDGAPIEIARREGHTEVVEYLEKTSIE